jgi:S-adenosylmethionine synthetase
LRQGSPSAASCRSPTPSASRTPVSIEVECFGTERIPLDRIAISSREQFDLRPGAILRDLDLWRPIYAKTAAYGHFGREEHDFTWERTDRADALRAAAVSPRGSSGPLSG